MAQERGAVNPEDTAVSDAVSRPLSDELMSALQHTYAVLKVSARPLVTEFVYLKDRIATVSRLLNTLGDRAVATLIAMGVDQKRAIERVRSWQKSEER